MFSKEFIDLTKHAHSKSQEKFSVNQAIEPNPYFIGFGNPNSEILLVGQEMAIDPEKSPVTLKMESHGNPEQWNEIIENNISDINYSFNGENGFKNPRKPYDTKPTETWRSYGRIVEKITCKKLNKNQEFFEHSFITEINTVVSKTQKGYSPDKERNFILHHSFFKNFPITILATGHYLKMEEIENIFDVKYSKVDSDSKNYLKFAVYRSADKKRILINTRQMSGFGRHKLDDKDVDVYFDKISDKVK